MFRTILLSGFALTLLAGAATAQIKSAGLEAEVTAEAAAPEPGLNMCLVAEGEAVEITINGQAYSCTPSEAALRGWCRPDCNQMHCCSTTNCTLGDTMQHAGDTLTCRATNQNGAPI